MNTPSYDPLRYVFIERTRCPACRSAKLKTQRSQTTDDGSVTRRSMKCLRCGHNFYGLLEADIDEGQTSDLEISDILGGDIQLLDKPLETPAKLRTR